MQDGTVVVHGDVEVIHAPTLLELAATANREHHATMAAVSSALRHAIGCGEALLAAKAIVEPGQWQHWLDENFDSQQNRVYMRLAFYRDRLPCDISIVDAKALVRGLPALGNPGGGVKTFSAAVHDEVLELRALGWTRRAIAREVGVSRSTVDRWLQPDGPRRERERQAKRRAASAAARAAVFADQRNREIGRAVRRAGAAMAELYAMAERMQDVLAQAHDETEDREARAALSLAGEHYRKMRDEVVRALGVS